ncbi:MFS transporter [Gordonia sp. zg691]|uniref:MFS transporter n=1 Tax=Gordonia jinghuaiqii TaxID=2758710 RepID=A0A7D7R9V2_9ACTN|nr:MFS transporter [Gordonia jinghuaiqii]MBD0863465.1 MFS transporter [Gordonia jinghuaiqii]QMT00990.1 MFS transporter [Gordonia jinghuaiqii]
MSGALGSALEFMDFTIYGILSATLFPKLFFSDLGETGGLLASFATFGVGFAARPLGAIVFGHLGDRIGRRPVLVTTLFLMGGCSILIGLLPTGKGIAVAAILVALRFIQGFSLGGEITGNQIMVIEHSDENRRGLMASFVAAGSPISQAVSNLLLVVLTAVLTESQWESWGWRIPFLGSILLIAVTFYIRRKLDETPVFLAEQEATAGEGARHGGGLAVLASQPLEVLKLVLVWGGPSMSYYLVSVYGLTELRETVGLSSNTTFIILLIANTMSCFCVVAGGHISDIRGRRLPMFAGLAGAFVGVALFFLLGAHVNLVVLTLIVALPLCSIQLLQGVQPALFAEQFPTRYRFAGSAMGLQCANLLFAAPAPFIATAVAASAGSSRAVLWVVLPILVVSILVMTTVRDNSQHDLLEIDADDSGDDAPTAETIPSERPTMSANT